MPPPASAGTPPGEEAAFDAAFSAACKAHESARVLAWHDHRETVFPHIYLEGG